MVYKLLFFVLTFYCAGCSNKYSSFEKTTREIFFNGNIQKSDKSLVEYYKNSKFLTLDPPLAGYTLYPPLSALGGNERRESITFRFKKHPYLSFFFREGELSIRTRESNKTKHYGEPYLRFFFDTKDQLDLAYNHLIKTYAGISTRNKIDTSENHINAQFTDDNSKVIREIYFTQWGWDELVKGYVLLFMTGNDLEKQVN